MKLVVATVAVVTTALAFSVGTATGSRAPRWIPGAPSRPVPAARSLVRPRPRTSASAHPSYSSYPESGTRGISTAALNSVIENYCQDCHNDNLMTGNLSLDGYDVAKAD